MVNAKEMGGQKQDDESEHEQQPTKGLLRAERVVGVVGPSTQAQDQGRDAVRDVGSHELGQEPPSVRTRRDGDHDREECADGAEEELVSKYK